MVRVRETAVGVMLAQRGYLFPFAPVFLAIGIGLYFFLAVEPPVAALAALAIAGLLGVAAGVFRTPAFGAPLCAAGLVALGCAVAGARAHWVAAPVIEGPYYGPVTGRVVAIDRSASDALRLTLDRVWLRDHGQAGTPRKVRISLHGMVHGVDPEPGMVVMTTAYLAPPGGAVEPGGFDFRRHAWFLGLGAVGYSRVPLMLWEDSEGATLAGWRLALSRHVQERVPGPPGAFAAAIMTGDRSAMPLPVIEDLRRANLAHLLAISGLHMGLLSGFVFAALRIALSLNPVGLVWPVKKLAALGALAAAAGYLALSGGNVATERAFVMVAVMLLAVVADRRALSLRAVALAALVVLVLRPESLLGPGFQMSFAATTALVAVFAAAPWRRVRFRWLGAVVSVVLSSAVAGAATAPFAMAHFNQFTQYGLLANLLCVPLMGVLVMPAAVVAAFLMPLGLDGLALHIMGLGLEWVLFVSHAVSGWSGAARPVPSPDASVLPILSFGGAFLAIWKGRGRWLGVIPMAVAASLWHASDRPDILVSESGGLVGVMTESGRALSRARGENFVAQIWLENDGRGQARSDAAALWANRTRAMEIRHVHGKRKARAFDGCAEGEIVISNVPLPDTGPCTIIGPDELRRSGSLAGTIAPDGSITFVGANDRSGQRLWNTTVRPDQ